MRHTLQFWYTWCYSSSYANLLRTCYCCFQTNSRLSCWWSPSPEWFNTFVLKLIVWGLERGIQKTTFCESSCLVRRHINITNYTNTVCVLIMGRRYTVNIKLCSGEGSCRVRWWSSEGSWLTGRPLSHSRCVLIIVAFLQKTLQGLQTKLFRKDCISLALCIRAFGQKRHTSFF